MLKVSNVDGGYRTLTNIGKNGGQEVPYIFIYLEEKKLAKWSLNLPLVF